MEQPIFGPGSELKSIVVVLFIGENDKAKLVILRGRGGRRKRYLLCAEVVAGKQYLGH